MKVLKFGGTSVKNATNIKRVKKIIENQNKKLIVVVSAFGGVTDKLIAISNLAQQKDKLYLTELEKLEKQHIDTLDELIQPANRESVLKAVNQLLNNLKNFLHGVFLVNELTPRALDYILSFGERLSALIISHTLIDAVFVDSREIIKTDDTYGKAMVMFKETNELIQDKFADIDKTAIVSGFISSTRKGTTTTLGRGGSDYTASIIATALSVEQLQIWTDVNGFMTADPSKVERAYPIKKLSYAEAMELSHFGAKVIFTPTIQPVIRKKIPILIKNTFEPEKAGTIIHATGNGDIKNPIKGISSIDDVTLITIQGSGLMGRTGISMRLFGALANASVNIILISQASSEYSISFAIEPEATERALKAIENEFIREISLNNSITVEVEHKLSVIAIVGENMKNTPGISAKLFNALGRNGINIVAIAQGSSELNISTVVSQRSLRKALNVVHEGFFLSDYTELHLFQVGVGTVGSSLLQQIKNQQQKLLKEHKLKINLIGVTNSRKMYFDSNGIDLSNYHELLEKSTTKADLPGFVQRLSEMNLRNSVFIDCTANKDVANLYGDVFKQYASVVTANKIACSSAYETYRKLIQSSIKHGVKFHYETNVGAGLPIMRTIGDLIKSGDKILKIEAVLSGTLNFIFNVLSPEISLSKAIHLAKEKGYSEPDPRIDLSGVDVLRKLLILSRDAGYNVESEDVQIKNFLPEECMNSESIDDFFGKVEKYNADFEAKRKKLAEQNKKWRYVASLDRGKTQIELIEVDAQHPFYNLEGSDNIILLTTERYFEQPLIVKGAGAGAAVTATGVFADLIRIANV